MLNILKKDDTLIVEGVDNNFFPNDGTLSIPLNSVIVVIDSSDMAVFKSASNGDVIFSALIGNIRIEGQPVTKDDIIIKFDAVSNAASGGGGGDVDAYTKSESDARYGTLEEQKSLRNDVEQALGEIAELEADKGDKPVVWKIGVSFLSETGVNIREGYQYRIHTFPKEEVSKIKVGDIIEDKDGLRVLLTNNTSFSVMKLYSGVLNGSSKRNVGTYNYRSDMVVTVISDESGGTYNGFVYVRVNTILGKGESAGKGIVTYSLTQKAYDDKQDLLVSGTNIKTVNGESLLGEGDIEISGGGGSSVNTFVFSNASFTTEQKITSGLPEGLSNIKVGDILEDKDGMKAVVTEFAKQEPFNTKVYTARFIRVNNSYESKYFTLEFNIFVTDSSVSIEQRSTSSGSLVVAHSCNLSPITYGLTSEGTNNNYLAISATNMGNSYVNMKIGDYIDCEDGSRWMVTSSNQGYKKFTGICIKYSQTNTTYTSFPILYFSIDVSKETGVVGYFYTEAFIKAAGESRPSAIFKLTQGAYDAKQDKLVSGTNIKTINGQSILGSGDIQISGGGGSYDDTELRQEIADINTSLEGLANQAGDAEANAQQANQTAMDVQNGLNSVSDRLQTLEENQEQDLAKLTEIQGKLNGVDSVQQKLSGNYLATFVQNGGSITFTQRGFDGLSSSEKVINLKTVNGQSLFGMGDISISGTKEWTGTQSQYDALGTYDDNTTYYIIG